MDNELSALYQFVEARVVERIRAAQARGDQGGVRTAEGSRRILEGIKGDLYRESLAREPAVGYLVRIADRYWDHPELPEFMYRR